MWLLLLTPALIYLVYRLIRIQRRKNITAKPGPGEWAEILEQNFPLYSKLPNQLKIELFDLMKVFLDEKQFVGCAGLEITQEMQVTIAAQACVLLLNRPTKYYPQLDSILVYPSDYRATETHKVVGVEHKQQQIRLGEAWRRGPIVLSWDSVLRGAHDPNDGHNVVFHEFAHNLDQEDGASDGAPLLGRRSRYKSWARVLSGEFAKLQAATEHGSKTLLDQYGASNPAEFFAVLTEAFFEKPEALKREHPELYQEIKQYYNVDPVAWNVSSTARGL